MSKLLFNHVPRPEDPFDGPRLETVEIPTRHGPVEVEAVAWDDPSPVAVNKVRRAKRRLRPDHDPLPPELRDSVSIDAGAIPQAPEPLK